MKWFVVYTIMFAGHLPASITAVTSEDMLSFTDFLSILAGWSFSMLVLELWNQHEFSKELESKIKL